jgi:hypothetical protein
MLIIIIRLSRSTSCVCSINNAVTEIKYVLREIFLLQFQRMLLSFVALVLLVSGLDLLNYMGKSPIDIQLIKIFLLYHLSRTSISVLAAY